MNIQISLFKGPFKLVVQIVSPVKRHVLRFFQEDIWVISESVYSEFNASFFRLYESSDGTGLKVARI